MSKNILNYCFAINSSQFIVFFVSKCKELLQSDKKTMYCDRSAYFQKAIKATARQLQFNTNLQWFFLLFGRLVVSMCLLVENIIV